MILHIFIHSIIFFVLSAASLDAQSMAMPNCNSMCGNVSIPYPFGIGKECYHDEWYAITCNNNTNKPFLSKFNMEVQEVNLRSTSITVMNPVASNCARQQKGNTIWSSTNFSGSPYAFFSSYNNKFVVVGCDNAQLYNNDETGIGCFLSCEPNNSFEGCPGINCCQILLTSSPKAFPFYTISIKGNTTIGCTYAFLVKIDTAVGKYFLSQSFVSNTKQAPVAVRWEMRNQGSNRYCLNSDNVTYYCECPDAQRGNPYIPNGCKNIKACAYCKKDCQENLYTGDFYCGNTTKIILGSTLGGGLFILLLCAFCFWLYKLIKKRRIAKLKKKFFIRNGGLLLKQHISSDEGTVKKTILFTSDELLKATDNFNENLILGKGGQGTVYKGMLVDGRITAVKKSKLIDESQLEQFINEVVILSQINHRNIVKLLGCCLETEVPLLVYEFVLNGTLFDLIHNENDEFIHSWKMRLQIATEVAGALAYLHSASSVPIYHRDIKSANILLDEKFRAKIADFGTSRSVAIDQTHLTTLVHGTFGYFDPEYFRSSQYTDKSDVYSFGVVLAELLTGQKAISSLTESDEERSLAARFTSCVEQMRVFDIIDPHIFEEAQKEEIIVASNIARRCLNLNGKRRPTMREVMTDLEVISGAPSTLVPVSIKQDTFHIEKNDQDKYSTLTMIKSDYRAFSSSDVDPLTFYTQ